MSSAISGISISPILARLTSSHKGSKSSAASSTPTIGSVKKSTAKAATSFLSQIEQAVTNALQSSQQSDASNPNDLVQSAIEQVFSQNPLPNQSTADAESANLTNPNGGTADSAHSAFLQSLKANGIDPEQFKTDFLQAVKDGKEGSANMATALKNLPTGSFLDTTA